MTHLIPYAMVAACGIGVLVPAVVALRAQSAHGRRVIAEMETRHAREIAEEGREMAEYRAELAALGVLV